MINTVNVSCNGGANGSLDISVSGGTPAYNYLWSTGAITQDVSGLSAATYTVTITDQNFCVGIFSFPISQPQTISASGNLTNIACNGGGTGAIDITVSGGTPSYTFLWSNGALVEDISALSAGTYTVTITDANACTHIQSFSLTQPSALSVGTSATQSGCGVGTGTATATPAGGTPGYSYLWSNGGITATISGLVPATYTVTVSDANNCTAVSSVVVSAANAPVISNASITAVTCNGGNDGAIDISVGGGTPSYTYLWSNGAVTEDISGLLAGTYTVTVQDVNNCSTSQSFLVGQPDAVTSTGVVTNVICNGGATGSINITPSGGNGLFTYLWSTAATTEDVSGLIAGLYTVTITDGNGCTGISSYTVVQANLITFGPVVTNVLCNGASTGSINLNMAGGTPPFTFLWSNGFTGEDPVNLAAGSYTVTVTDINSCTRSRVVNLSQPSAINAVVNTTNASCGVTNGTATVIASGGTGGLTYLWNTGATVSSISSLAAGTYTVTVTDAALCTATASGQVVTASGPVISSVVIDSVSCYGDSDGAINITTTGGATPLTFLWSNGALTEDVTGLIADVYTVTVTDQNSCTTTGTYTIAQPDSLQATFSSTPASCGLANGALSAVVTGGTPPYLYLWSTGGTGNGITGVIAGTYTVTVTDANNCSSQFSSTINGTGGPVIDSSNVQNLFCNNDTSGAITIYLSGGAAPLSILWSNGANTQNVSNLTAGNYTVTVTDFAGCSVLQTFSVTQPPALLSPMTSQPSFCGQATGQAQSNPSGGTPPYTYLWNNGQTTQSITALTAGTYNVTVTDANGCTRRRNVAVTLSNGPVISLVAQQDVICPGATTGSIDINVIGGITPYVYSWSQGGTQQDVSVLAAGTYTVVVTDSVACSDSAVFVILEPDTFNVVPVIQDASCGGSNGSISLTVSGATSPYTFLWAGGQTTSAISGLTAGTYTVTISDSNSCDTTLSFLVSAQSGPLAVLDSLRNVRCFGANTGRIYTSVSGGTVPFTYLWNDGNTNQDRLSVFAGTYTLTVSDAGGCTDTLSVTITQNAQITASFTSIQATCNQSNGSATVTPGGGVGPYTYLWETGSSAQTLTAIPAGTYSVTITDILGCTFLDSVAVSNSGAPALQLQNQIQPSCFGGTNGSLTVSISGGTTPYVVIWSNGDTGNTADSLAAGTYTVTVTDGTGCTSSQQFSLGQPPAIVLQLQSVGASCGQLNGLATVIATGGTGTFTYLWSNGVANDSIKNVAAGLFTVTVTDQNLCVRQDTIRVQNLNGPQLNVNQLTNVSCFGLSNGAINISVSGGSNPFQYIWSSGQTTQDLNNIPAGNYSLIVTDNTGCKDTTFVTVTQPTDIAIQSAVVDASCGSSNGAAFVTVNGGVPAYTYLWSNGGTADSINNVVAGSYTVTVTDANGCTKVDNVIIGNLNGPAVSLVSMTAVTCPGDSTGQLAIDVLFGTPPFTYLWSNGSVSQNLSNVPAGIYTLTVTDDNGCTNLFVDTITEPSALLVNAPLTEPSCNLSNGIIVAQTTGGTSGYTYLWNTGNASSTISGLNSGTYTVTVTDAASCIFDTSFTISNTGIPVISSVTVDSVSCFGTADGSIDIDISGGVTPYLYTWVNTSQTTQDVNNLAAGNYSVIVTDNRGCTASQAFNVSQPQELLISFAGLQNAACGLTNGEVVVNASGGIPGYSFLWSNGSVNDSLANLPAGSYTVTVTDFNGCSVSNIANISNLSGPVILAVDSSNITCNGGLDGFIAITATGVSLPLTYSWAGLPDTDSALTNLSQGLYTVTITDALGCVAIRTITLTEPQPFTINSVSPQNNPPYNISCFGLADGELFLSVTGGTAPYNFVWSNGAITQNLQNLTADLYTVFITDDNNCGTYQTFLLTQPLQLVANAGTDLIICGENNVTLFADTPALGIGYWQVISSLNTISFSDSTSPSSTISNLSIGDNVLLWTISDGICSDDDLLTITVTSEIEAIGGTDRSVCISEVNLNATRPEFGYGYWTSLTGDVQIDDTSRAFTRVIGLNFGNNSFLWTVVNGGCRDSAVVNIFRRDSLECLPKIQLPTAFSPNFDGSNDYLVIKGLEEYPDNEIVVYNRWGQNVYTQKSYRNDWYGTDNEGYPLADGTYFVIVKVNFINKVYNTYIDLRR
ncbi:MAG: gliding motility-associated C-terminal domain-containing protein [Bacteroidetes bacterium]|nr:gliding motility-associated C-terminal domain-containing protein [Bacteroidota bacterium]